MDSPESTNPASSETRVHEKWPGNETFLCNGRVVGGPSPGAAVWTAALVLVPSAVFCVFVVNESLRRRMGDWTLAVSIASPLWCVFWLFKTSFTDPGILPRLERRPGTSSMRGKTRETTVATTGRTATTRWNDTCGYFQPLRAHHCSVMNDCVERFDHHCPWTGTTIGRRNYRAFLTFTFSTAALCAWTMVMCGYAVSYRSRGEGAHVGMRRSGVAITVFIVAAFGFFFVGALSCFHAYLISTNQTTYENFKDAHGWRTNPFNTGSVFKNCFEVWCARIGPPRMRFDAPQSEDASAKEFERELAEEDARRRDVEMGDASAANDARER